MVANAVINAENASLKTMNTGQLLDLFTTAETKKVWFTALILGSVVSCMYNSTCQTCFFYSKWVVFGKVVSNNHLKYFELCCLAGWLKKSKLTNVRLKNKVALKYFLSAKDCF